MAGSFAGRQDLDGGGGNSEDGPVLVATSGQGRSRPRTQLVAATLALVFVVAVAAASLVRDDEAPSLPTRAYVSGNRLYVQNAAGEELWNREFEGGLNGPRYSAPHAPPWFLDVTGDGSAEVLFVQRHAEPGMSEVLYCFAANGDEIWQFVPGAEVRYENESFADIYRVKNLEVGDLGDGRRVLVAASSHYSDEPTQIALLRADDGVLISDYWHSGHLGGERAALRLADLNGDGVAEIYAAGVSNSRNQATLVVLDPDAMQGASKEPKEKQLLGFETDVELARVFFPQSTLNKRTNNSYNVAIGVYPNGETLRVGIGEDYMSENVPTVHYDLNSEYELVQINPSDLFETMHEELYREDASVGRPIEELGRLRREGVDVVMPRIEARTGR